MSNVNFNTLGKDEQTESAPFVQFFAPTDFDTAVKAISVYIKDNMGFLDEYKYLGLFNGPVKSFLKKYIEASYEFNASYSNYQKTKWYNYFKSRWNFATDELDVYFSALVATNDMGKIPRNIFSAYTYTPSKDTVLGGAIKDAAKYSIFAVGMYAVGYLLLREYLFGTKKKQYLNIKKRG